MLIKDCFPVNQFPVMREDQVKVLDDIDAFVNSSDNDINVILLEAPTGFGKSAVGVTLAKYFGRSFIITGTKELQSQYINDYPFMKKMIGKNNFDCPILTATFERFNCAECKKTNPTKWVYEECTHKSAEYAPCQYDANYMKGRCDLHVSTKHYQVSNAGSENESFLCIKPINKDLINGKNTKDPCQSYHQKAIGMMASHTALNYKIYLSYFKGSIMYEPESETEVDEGNGMMGYVGGKKKSYSVGLGHRPLVVFDEAHLIETELIDFVGFELSEFWFDFINSNKKKHHVYLPTTLNKNDLYGWLDVLKDYNRSLAVKISEGKMSDYWKVKIINQAAKVSDTIAKISEKPDDWIVAGEEHDRHTKNPKRVYKRVKFKPIDLAEYCNRLFRFDKANNFLLMSATILDKEMYCKSIGLNSKNVKFIQLESSFPVDNRPIYYINDSPYMNFAAWNNADSVYRWVKYIDKIMSAYSNSKGIIHVTSTDQMRTISNGVSEINRRRIIETRSENNEIERDEVMRQHKIADKPTVILSPSMNTGIDLKDDLSRFQIIGKVPYPGQDVWVKRKMSRDRNWYNWMTSLKFIQAYGRSIRSSEDWCDTFLVDSMFTSKFLRDSRFIPKWVKDAFKPSINIDQVKDIARKRGI